MKRKQHTPQEIIVRDLYPGFEFENIKVLIDTPEQAFELLKLVSVEMRAQRAGDMAKTYLPQHCEIEQTFNQNHRGKLANRFPGEQAALGAGKESMGKGGSDTAAVEVDDASALAAREDDAPVEGVAALWVEQAETLQEIATTQSSTSAVIFDPVRGDGKWDKKNRSSLELCHGVDLPRSEPEAELLPPEAKTQLKQKPN